MKSWFKISEGRYKGFSQVALRVVVVLSGLTFTELLKYFCIVEAKDDAKLL